MLCIAPVVMQCCVLHLARRYSLYCRGLEESAGEAYPFTQPWNNPQIPRSSLCADPLCAYFILYPLSLPGVPTQHHYCTEYSAPDGRLTSIAVA